MELTGDLHELTIVLIAAAFGGVIGLERELSDKPAGLRTHIFVAAGSALLMLLAQSILDSFKDEGSGVINADPIRVMQAIVVGISFLGAGTIIHQGGERVEGLTTAASVFLTAGIGIASALGDYVLAGGTTVMAVLVLTCIGWVEKKIAEHNGSDDQADPKVNAAANANAADANQDRRDHTDRR